MFCTHVRQKSITQEQLEPHLFIHENEHVLDCCKKVGEQFAHLCNLGLKCTLFLRSNAVDSLCARNRGFIMLCPLYLLPFSLFFSYILDLLLLFHFILAVPMRRCSGRHLCMSSVIPVECRGFGCKNCKLLLRGAKCPCFCRGTACKNQIIFLLLL